MKTTHYETLGVSEKAPSEVIRAAYKVLMQSHHPDKDGSSNDAIETTKRINLAYEVLSDPIKRRAYDAYLAEIRGIAIENNNSPPHNNQNRICNKNYELSIIPGTVVANDVWSDTSITSKGGGGITLMGYGFTSSPKINSVVVQHQRITVNTSSGYMFIEKTGDHIPAVVGNNVEVVQVASPDPRKHRTSIALINRTIGLWHSLLTPTDAGKATMTGWEKAGDALRLVAIVGTISVVLWMLLIRHYGILVQAGFLLLAVPVIFASTTTSSKACGLGKEIFNEINKVALRGT